MSNFPGYPFRLGKVVSKLFRNSRNHAPIPLILTNPGLHGSSSVSANCPFAKPHVKEREELGLGSKEVVAVTPIAGMN